MGSSLHHYRFQSRLYLGGAISKTAQLGNVLESQEGLIGVPLSCIPTDLPLPHPLYVLVNSRYVLFRSSGDKLSRARINQFIAKEVDTVFVSPSDWLVFLGELELETQKITRANCTQADAVKLRNLLFLYTRSLEEKRFVQEKMIEKITELISRVVGILFQSPELAKKLTKKYNSPNFYFSSHSLNMSIQSIRLGLALGLNRKQVRHLALGGVFSNIGNLEIPTKILSKQGPLNESDWRTIKTHPSLGVKTLEKYSTDPEVIEIVAFHHEREDGSGYEKGLKGYHLPFFPRILAVVDVYDALTSRRPYAEALNVNDSVEILEGLKNKLEPDLVDLFLSAHINEIGA